MSILDFFRARRDTLLPMLATAAVMFTCASVNADLIVYEDFNYPVGADVVGQTGGMGLTGSYTGVTAGGAGTANVDAIAGLSYGTLEVNGQALARTNRAGRGTISRALDPMAAADLAASPEVWFSVLMDPTAPELFLGNSGQNANTFATLIFGSDGLTDASTGAQNGTGTDIANGGDAFGVGFFGNTAGFDGVGIQAVGFSDGVIDQPNDDTPPNGTNSIVTGDSLSFIVGQIAYDVNGGQDVLTLFDVATSGAATPFASLSLDLDQASFDTISIADGQTALFDEIRIGQTVGDVTPGLTFTAVPEPSALGLLALVGVSLATRRRR